MNKRYLVYFQNTDIVQEIIAETWEISDDNMLLSFYQSRSMVSRKNDVIAVFNLSNIIGFKEDSTYIYETTENEDDN